LPLAASDFGYDLPEGLVAQRPCAPRDHCRLMCLNRHDQSISHEFFYELPRLLRPGDLLVVNNTRVIPAKFNCLRKSGAKIEGLFLRETGPGQWEVMLRNAGRCSPGEKLELMGAEEIGLKLLTKLEHGLWTAEIPPGLSTIQLLGKIGRTPLPPYISRKGAPPDLSDQKDYQTVYASSPGAVAAPTAGLHFTERVLSELSEKDISLASVTLHVGLGTFAPVRQESLSDHKMHREWYDLPQSTAREINNARRQSRRIVAVGTTSIRVLESAAASGEAHLEAQSGWTDLFVYPPSRFRVVDALITNFHLPHSTLLMLVAAFCSPGREDGLRMLLNAYREAVRYKYMFYSYGDAMLIE